MRKIMRCSVLLILLLLSGWAAAASADPLPEPDPAAGARDDWSGLPEELQQVQADPANPSLLGTEGFSWYERLRLTEDGMNLYRLLVEASDHDGVDDFLIDDSYYDLSGPLDSYSQHGAGELVRIPMANGIRALTIISHVLPYGSDTGRTRQEAEELVRAELRMCHFAFLRDHTEVFWPYLHRGAQVTLENRQVVYGFFILRLQSPRPGEEFDYRDIYADQQLLEEKIALWHRSAARILEEAAFTEQTTDLEKIRFLNSWLLLHNSYNTSQVLPNQAFNSLAGLVGSGGTEGPVCEGFAESFHALCKLAGVPCLIDGGYVYQVPEKPGDPPKRLGKHAWNQVRLDGNWYAIDVTWNEDDRKQDAVIPDHCYEKYFLLGGETLAGWKGNQAQLTFSQSHEAESWGSLLQRRPELHPTMYEPAHVLEETVEKAPGCTEPGLQYRTCTACLRRSFLVRDTQVLPPLGHAWTWETGSDGARQVCTRDPSHQLEPLHLETLLVNGAAQLIPAERLTVELRLRGGAADAPVPVMLSAYDARGQMCHLSTHLVTEETLRTEISSLGRPVTKLQCMVADPDHWVPLTAALTLTAK